MTTDTREVVVSLRLTAVEMEALAQRAIKRKRTMSDLLRLILFGEEKSVERLDKGMLD